MIDSCCRRTHLERIMQATETAPVRYGTQSDWGSRNGSLYRSASIDDDDDDRLPRDPRHWTREHVAHWLKYVIRQHGLPEVPVCRFLMNGKALCLMSPRMFLNRVPLGGKLLYKDFQLRLCAAMYAPCET